MAQISTATGTTNGLLPVDLPPTPAIRTIEVRIPWISAIRLWQGNLTPIGTAPSSAPENVGLTNYVNALAKASTGLKLFIDYHSYSQLFMTRKPTFSPSPAYFPFIPSQSTDLAPAYGYSCTAVTANNAEYQSLAQGAVAAIKAIYGTVFKAGAICPTIYQVSGSSVDYVTDVSKAQYTFTSELRDTGSFGFVLPANQILPSAVEAFAGFRYLLLNLR